MQEVEHVIFQRSLPGTELADFVKCSWMIENPTPEEKKFTILPDGYFDVVFRMANNRLYAINLAGLATREIECVLPGNSSFFAISFKLT